MTLNIAAVGAALGVEELPPPIIEELHVYMGRCPLCGYASSKLAKRDEVERRTLDHILRKHGMHPVT